MGKGDRRGKSKPAGIPALAKITPGRANPRDRRGTNKPEDAARVALMARHHHFTDAKLTDEARDKVKAQHMGCHIGFVMQHECPKDAPRLWRVWQAWCQAELTYQARIIGKTGSPQGSSVQAIPEKVETDTGHTVDLRTSDERDQDAVKSWTRWRGFIGHLSTADATALHHARREDGPALWRARKPTRAGLAAMAALDRLAVVVEG